jgi:hypothetical protein
MHLNFGELLKETEGTPNGSLEGIWKTTNQTPSSLRSLSNGGAISRTRAHRVCVQYLLCPGGPLLKGSPSQALVKSRHAPQPVDPRASAWVLVTSSLSLL